MKSLMIFSLVVGFLFLTALSIGHVGAQPPEPPTVSGTIEPETLTNKNTITLSGTVWPPESSVNIYINDVLVATVATEYPISGDYSHTLTLNEGPNLIEVAAVHENIGMSSRTSYGIITVDTIAPAAPVLPVFLDEIYTQTLRVSGTAEAGSIVKIYVNDNLASTTTAGTDGSFNITVTLGEGSNIITAKTTDAAGNVSQASSAQTVMYGVPTGPVKSIDNVKAGENAVFSFAEYELTVDEVVVAVKNTVFSPGVVVENATLPTGVSPPSGIAYSYFQITTNVENEYVESAKVQFKVSLSWIKENDIDPNTVKLYKYQGDRWKALSTVLIGEDASYLYYSAQTSSLSLFVVMGEQARPIPTALYIGVVLIVVICLLVYAALRKR
ncbi:MAG: PGF-pre-PGF domain-containing protein [Hadesarchaea archaeon]|nr:PGF-pre-PGF domain-containing protein [Hadesarchaea archaeon]